MPELSGSVTITSTYTYSNPATKFLTETNSAGVVTGLPGQSGQPEAVTSQPAVVTSQPPVATLPAALPSGYNTIYLNVSSHLTSITVSAGKSTTTILGDADVSTVGPGGHQTGGAGRPHGGSPTHGGQQASSASASASSTETGAASNMKVASAGMLGLGALFAALL